MGRKSFAISRDDVCIDWHSYLNRPDRVDFGPGYYAVAEGTKTRTYAESKDLSFLETGRLILGLFGNLA